MTILLEVQNLKSLVPYRPLDDGESGACTDLEEWFFRGLFINDYWLNHDNHDVSIFLGLLFQSQSDKYNTNLGCYLYSRQGTRTVTVTIDLWFI